MAKKLINAICDGCRNFRPRCARVFRRMTGRASSFESVPTVLCEHCRKSEHGAYRLDDCHK